MWPVVSFPNNSAYYVKNVKIKVCGRPVEVRKALTRHQIETATKRRENQARRGTMERERYQREPGPGSHYGGYGDPRGRPGQFFIQMSCV